MSKAELYELDMLRGDMRRLAQENTLLRDKLAAIEALRAASEQRERCSDGTHHLAASEVLAVLKGRS